MVFLLVGSVIALHDTTKKTDLRQEKKYIEEAAFNNINNAFNNVYEEVISLNKEGNARIIQIRSLPFSYDFNKNSIILSQQIPIRLSVLDAYIDTLNVYRIFTGSGLTTDLNIVTGTLQNTAWDGGEDYPDFNYAILPQCLLYDVNADSTMVLRELEAGQFGCEKGFNYTDLNIIDINISIDSSLCTAGSHLGTLELTGLSKPYPEYRITVNETNPSYPITGGGKLEYYGHFDPESYGPGEDWFTIKCNTGGSEEPWLRVKLGMESANDPFPFVAKNFIPAQPVDIDLNMVFDTKVDLFYFTGFSISVNKVNFPIKRTT